MDQQFDDDAVRKIAKAVSRVLRDSPGGGWDPGRGTSQPASRSAVVRVQATGQTNGMYPAAMQQGQLAWTGGGSFWSDVAAGAQDCWLFAPAGQATTAIWSATMYGTYTDGKAIFVANNLVVPSPAITVKGTNPGTGDSTITLTGITTLDVNEGSGLSVGSVSGTEAVISAQAASTTHAGVVTTGTQSFTGAKTFDGFGPVTFQAGTTSWNPAGGGVAFSFPLVGNLQFNFGGGAAGSVIFDTNGIHLDNAAVGNSYYCRGSRGATGSFTSADVPAKTVTVTGGIVTGIV